MNDGSLLAGLIVWICVGASAQAQTDKPTTTMLHGIVVEESGNPVGDARVELSRDSSVIRRATTNLDGLFSFDSLAIGAYRLRVLRVGYVIADSQLALLGPIDSVRVQLQDPRRIQAAKDSLNRIAWAKRLAAARARARHWDCTTSAADLRSIALEAFSRFPGDPTQGMHDAAREYGMPMDSATFLRDFRPVASRAECRRLAESIDRQWGLVDDHLKIFRIGKVYYLPDFGDGGTIVALSGKIIAVYIVPS